MIHKIRFLSVILLVLFCGAYKARAQETAHSTGLGQEKTLEAIKCWWKTDRSTVRIGEQFGVVLTCQVVETDLARVVLSEGALEPSAISLAPYTSVGGVKYEDIHRGNFRFFQYKYDLKLTGEDFFGKEVPIPPLEIQFKVDKKIQNENISTKESAYRLPALPMKIISLVPKDTKDIRDSSGKTFGTIKELRFKAILGFIFAGLLLIVPLAVISLPFWRAVRARQKRSSNGTLFSNATLLRRMCSELKYAKGLRDKNGWHSEIVSKVVTVCRIAGAIAMSRNISQLSEKFETRGLEGQLKLRKGWLWPKKVMISSDLTLETMRANTSILANGRWIEEFGGVFEVFNYARYSPEKLDEAQLDAFLDRCAELVKKLHRRNFWFVRKSLAFRAGFKEWRPQWSRIRS